MGGRQRGETQPQEGLGGKGKGPCPQKRQVGTLRTPLRKAAPPGKIFSIFTTGCARDSMPPEMLIPKREPQCFWVQVDGVLCPPPKPPWGCMAPLHPLHEGMGLEEWGLALLRASPASLSP